MTRDNLIIAIALIMFAAFLLGWFSCWLVGRLTRPGNAELKVLDKAIREMDKRKAEAAKAAGKRAAGNRQARGVKDAVQALHDEVKLAERFYTHIAWLQERFPQAAYNDVTGLCKLASRAEMQERTLMSGPPQATRRDGSSAP